MEWTMLLDAALGAVYLSNLRDTAPPQVPRLSKLKGCRVEVPRMWLVKIGEAHVRCQIRSGDGGNKQRSHNAHDSGQTKILCAMRTNADEIKAAHVY